VTITVTNSSGGGQPVSMANIQATCEITARHRIPLYLDACRFADGCAFSAKKDGFANIGGFCSPNTWSIGLRLRPISAGTSPITESRLSSRPAAMPSILMPDGSCRTSLGTSFRGRLSQWSRTAMPACGQSRLDRMPPKSRPGCFYYAMPYYSGR
jgi:beta-eliminating lyase